MLGKFLNVRNEVFFKVFGNFFQIRKVFENFSNVTNESFFQMRKFSFHVRFAFACSTIFFLSTKNTFDSFILSYSEMIKRLSVYQLIIYLSDGLAIIIIIIKFAFFVINVILLSTGCPTGYGEIASGLQVTSTNHT